MIEPLASSPQAATSTPPAEAVRAVVSIENDIAQALEICRGDYKAALRMVMLASPYYEEEIARLKGEVSTGYTRGRVKPTKAS